MKGAGFDVVTFRRIFALRKKDQAERQEEPAIVHSKAKL
ncbi:GapR family DNA-binding domain-containing protein [Methylobacterium sp. CM6247]